MRLYVDPSLIARWKDLVDADPAANAQFARVLERADDQLEFHSDTEISSVLDTLNAWSHGRLPGARHPDVPGLLQRLTSLRASELSRSAPPRAWFPIVDMDGDAASAPEIRAPAPPIRRAVPDPFEAPQRTRDGGAPAASTLSADLELPTHPLPEPVRHETGESAEQLLSRLGTRLGLKVISSTEGLAGGEALPKPLQELDVLWMRDGEVVTGFCCGVGSAPEMVLLKLSDARIATGGSVQLFAVGDRTDLTRLSRALERPSFQFLKLNSGIRLLLNNSLEKRLQEVWDLTPYLRHEFIEHFSEPL